MLHLRFDLDLVELSQQLTLLHAIAVVDQQFLHNAAGLRLHFDLRDRRNFAGRHHALGEVSLFHFGELGGVDLGAAAGRRKDASGDQQHDYRDHADPNNQSATLLFAISAVTVHNSSSMYRQLEIGSHCTLTLMYAGRLSFVPELT